MTFQYFEGQSYQVQLLEISNDYPGIARNHSVRPQRISNHDATCNLKVFFKLPCQAETRKRVISKKTWIDLPFDDLFVFSKGEILTTPPSIITAPSDASTAHQGAMIRPFIPYLSSKKIICMCWKSDSDGSQYEDTVQWEGKLSRK